MIFGGALIEGNEFEKIAIQIRKIKLTVRHGHNGPAPHTPLSRTLSWQDHRMQHDVLPISL